MTTIPDTKKCELLIGYYQLLTIPEWFYVTDFYFISAQLYDPTKRGSEAYFSISHFKSTTFLLVKQIMYVNILS